jgi:3-hydroxymyristoyl/3-hydroxydecanoyl-(acyl carrier protein) dehydratase
MAFMMSLPTALRRSSGSEDVFLFTVEPDHLAFQGHFPDDPILPGVIQVDWAIRFGAEAFGPLGDFKGLSNLKFMGVTRPLEPLELGVAYDRESGRLEFRLDGPSGRKSSGTVLFDSAP